MNLNFRSGIALVSMCVILLIFSCKSKESQVIKELPSVLVQLHDATTSEALEKEFKEYELAEQKVVSRPMNIFLYTFNSEKITDLELIKQLKKSELVKEAQQNKEIQLRN